MTSKGFTATFIALLSLGMVAQADWLDTFDSEAADSGAPDNYGVFGGGTLDSGVTATLSVSAPQSAFVVVNLDGLAFNFTSILVHDPGVAMDLTGGTLSADVLANIDLSSTAGNVAFHLYDADGSEWRTGNADLFAPTTTFGNFSQNVSALSEQVVVGTTPGLDTGNIVRYGLDFYDQPGAGNQDTTFNVDNLQGSVAAVPEPGTASLMLLSLLAVLRFRTRRS